VIVAFFFEKEATMPRSASRLSRVVVTGPLAPFVQAYRRELRRRGYTPRSAVNQLRQVARLSRWLEDRELGVERLDRERVEEFFAFQRAGGRHRAQWSRPGLWCLLELLEVLGALEHAGQARALSPTETLLCSFERYLLVERVLASCTVRGYLDHARKFLDGLPPGTALAELTAPDVSTALRRVAGTVSVAAAQNFRAGLRAFLRFCFTEGILAVDLSGAALAVTGRRRVSLPRGIEPVQARALLSACDRRTTLGRRDHAMLVVLLRLGLRAGEVARLRLDDLDWRAGELVVRGKGARLDRLPLPVEVGEAIAGYLRRGRPRSDRREVFLRARAPFEPIATGTVGSTVRRACRRAGITEIGPHRLRHTLACEMVRAEVPLVEIAEVLRHKSLQSSAIYARVDLDTLRTLAAPWPGGRR
jgi:integrase/recombinase XerD